MKLRLVRLYPLFLIGALIGIFRYFGHVAEHATYLEAAERTAKVAIPNLLFIPVNDPAGIFPVNAPAWSLFFELVANFAWVAFLWKFRIRYLIPIILGSLGIFLLGAFAGGYRGGNLGVGPESFWWGFPRVNFSFFLGVVLSRAMRENRTNTYAFLAPVILLFLICINPISLNYEIYFEAVALMALIPCALYLGAKWETPDRFSGVARFLGDISYPVYVLHYPLVRIFYYATRMIKLPTTFAIIAFFPMIIAISWVALKIYDEPVRSALMNRTRKLASKFA